MPARSYGSPEAFKQALEQRLRQGARTSADFTRQRQLVVFERFLVRAIAALGDAVTLKGGLVLEQRLQRARTTKDIDLRLTGSPDQVVPTLREAARHTLNDFMTFEMQPDAQQPRIQSEGMIYEGLRFRAECRLAGARYGNHFGVDLAFGDPLFGDPDVTVARDTLGFAGIAPPELRLYPIETHIAEKLHAYTLPRPRPNTRVKDLPDLALLASIRPIGAAPLRLALTQTFSFRRTHPLPSQVPDPAASWAGPYGAMAEEASLHWRDLEELVTAVRGFLHPVLAGESEATWIPAEWRWEPQHLLVRNGPETSYVTPRPVTSAPR